MSSNGDDINMSSNGGKVNMSSNGDVNGLPPAGAPACHGAVNGAILCHHPISWTLSTFPMTRKIDWLVLSFVVFALALLVTPFLFPEWMANSSLCAFVGYLEGAL